MICELRRRRAGIVFHVYGSSVPAEFAALAAEDVVIEGYVESVDLALDRARVFVAPLRSGAGIKGKVLEALASGIPSVLSPIGAVSPCADDSAHKVFGSKSASWAGGGPARIRSAVDLQNATTRSVGGGSSSRISRSSQSAT